MKVLHIINDLSIRRGAERLVSELVLNLKGHTVVSFRSKNVQDYRFEGQRFLRIGGFWRLAFFLFLNRTRYDVFHFHLFPSFYLSFIVGKKSVIHEHGNATNNRRNGKWPFYLIEWFLFRACGFVLTVSNEAKRNLLSKFNFLDGKIDVIPNFLPPTFSSGRVDSTEWRKRPVIKIGMIAAFVPGKRHDIVLKAISLLNRQVELHLIGSGVLIDEYRVLARTLGIEDRVTFHGSVSDVARFYCYCDLFLLVSDFESFGLVVLEAASFGKRTICSNIEGLNSVCPVEVDLVENRVEDLVHAIEYFDLDGCYKEELEAIVKKYSFEKYVSNLEKIYQMIVRQEG